MTQYLFGSVATLLGVFLATRWLEKSLPALRAGVVKQTQIEGPLAAFRGLLALLVYIHHQAFVITWINSGGWGCDNNFILFLGHGAVFLFLMITGYVFWLKSRETGGKLSWGRQVVGRFRRLAPAYYFSLSLVLIQALPVLLISPWQSGFEFVLRTLAVGLIWWKDIPGLQTVLLNGHVHFILFYQWCFYLGIPLLAGCCTRRRFPPFFIFLSVVAVFAQRKLGASVWWLGFLPGILIAQVQLTTSIRKFLGDWPGTICALIWAAGVLGFGGLGWLQFELVAVVPLLWVVVSGSTLFGLLNWEVLRLMGKLSYSFYLLHVIVLMAVIRLLKQWFPGCLDEPPILGGDYSDFNHSNRSVIGCLLALG